MSPTNSLVLTSTVLVGAISAKESKLLFQLKLGEAQSQAIDNGVIDQLSENLGHIPLAITQAAAFTRRNWRQIERYAQSIAGDDEKMISYLIQERKDARRPREFPNSIFRTWKIPFKRIAEQEPPIDV